MMHQLWHGLSDATCVNIERHRALLIGMNYEGSHCQLQGCINDVYNVRDFLVNKTGRFRHSDVRTVCDDDQPDACTRAGILNELQRLASQTKTEKLAGVWIHISSHGASVDDTDDSETDGEDEAIYAADGRLIIDDEIAALLRTFNVATKVVAIFDCCHSGTALDLPYRWITNTEYSPEGADCGDRKVMMLSGCRDDGTSADASWQRAPAGALTSRFISTLCLHPDLNVFATVATLRQKLISEGFTQAPQLSSSFLLTETTTWL